MPGARYCDRLCWASASGSPRSCGAELPGLTVHDITHLDALWRVADQIAGPDYPINPAEAFVLGGAFLLHDAAHVMAAYPGGISSIKRTVQWQDLIAQRYGGRDPEGRSDEERSALFQVLRYLHAEQAHTLARLDWAVPGGPQLHLLEHLELREYYADLIGEIAESHHWPSHRVAEVFHDRRVSAPGFMQPANWEVDALKVAFLLRTADAAHIDGLRAPWFLFALRRRRHLGGSLAFPGEARPTDEDARGRTTHHVRQPFLTCRAESMVVGVRHRLHDRPRASGRPCVDAR